MNRSCKYILFDFLFLLFIVSASTQCMFIKKSSLISILVRQCHNKNNSEKKLRWGPIKEHATTFKSDYPSAKPEPWSSNEVVERYSAEEMKCAIKQLENIHKTYSNEFDSKNTHMSTTKIDISNQIKSGDIFKHYKGNYYKIIDLSCDSENLTWYVVYKALYDNKVSQIWHRQVKEFLGTVEVNGKSVQRFEKIDRFKGITKKKRTLETESRWVPEPMGTDELKYSISAKEFAAMLPELEEQHRANSKLTNE